MRNYVQLGWEYGYAPADLFGGFAELVAGRAAELDKLRCVPNCRRKRRPSGTRTRRYRSGSRRSPPRLTRKFPTTAVRQPSCCPICPMRAGACRS